MVELCGLDFSRGQKAVFHERVEIDHEIVARGGRETLVRRIAKAGVAEREHLPVTLARSLKKIDEIVCGFAERAHAVGRGQGCDVHKHTAGAFKHRG